MKKIAILLAGLQTVSFGMRSANSPEKHSSNSSQILELCEMRFGSDAVSKLGKKLSEAVIAEHTEAIEDLIRLDISNSQRSELFVETIEELFKTKTNNKNDQTKNKNDQERICALEAEIKELRASENKNQNIFQGRETGWFALQRENETKNLERNKMQQDIMGLEAKILNLESELEQASQNRETADSHWRVKLDRLKEKQKQDLENTTRESCEDKQKLWRMIEDQTVTLKKQNEVLGKQNNTIQTLKSEIEALKELENETKDQEINKKKQDELHHRISALQLELEHTQTRLQQALNNSEKDSGSKTYFEQNIKNHETEIAQYKKMLETTQQKNTSLSCELKAQYEQIKKQDDLLRATNSTVSQLKDEIKDLKSALLIKPKEALESSKHEYIAPEELLFQGEILRKDPNSRQFVKQELERILGKKINRTKYLGDYDSEIDAGSYQPSFSHRIYNGKGASTDILLVIHTPGGSIMAAFSEQIYANPADGKKGILFGLNKNNHISVVSENTDKLRSVRCDFGYLYWGSSEFSLKLSNCALSVNCNGMIGDTGYKRTNKNHMVRNHYFLTEEECEKNNNMKVKRIECYQVIFKEPN